jgi:hypothetical protein
MVERTTIFREATRGRRESSVAGGLEPAARTDPARTARIAPPGNDCRLVMMPF